MMMRVKFTPEGSCSPDVTEVLGVTTTGVRCVLPAEHVRTGSASPAVPDDTKQSTCSHLFTSSSGKSVMYMSDVSQRLFTSYLKNDQ